VRVTIFIIGEIAGGGKDEYLIYVEKAKNNKIIRLN